MPSYDGPASSSTKEQGKTMNTRALTAGAGILLAFTLTACGGSDTSSTGTEAPNDTVAGAQQDIGAPSNTDPAEWFKENCPTQGWKLEDNGSGKESWSIAQAALTTSPEEETNEDLPRIYEYDELNNVATPVAMLDSTPICWKSTFTFDKANGLETKDSQGDDLYLMKVSSPSGDMYVNESETGRALYEKDGENKFDSGDIYEYAFEYNDFENIQDPGVPRPEDCELVPYSSCAG